MRDERLYLQDMLESITRIERYLAQVDRAGFFQETLFQDAIIRNLAIIGEAVKNLSELTRHKQSQIPWPEIMRMRDRLTHHYFRVDLEIVWETATRNLVELKSAVRELVEELENGEDT
jgi:uncharacterized protein with HEPN domain